MTHTTLQKYTQHVTGKKDNHSELTKFEYKNHGSQTDVFFTGNLPKNIDPLLLWPIEDIESKMFTIILISHS